MPQYIYRPFHQSPFGAAMGSQQVKQADIALPNPTAGGSLVVDPKSYEQIAKNNKFAGALGEKLKKLKIIDKEALEKKKKQNKPITFSL